MRCRLEVENYRLKSLKESSHNKFKRKKNIIYNLGFLSFDSVDNEPSLHIIQDAKILVCPFNAHNICIRKTKKKKKMICILKQNYINCTTYFSYKS